MDAYTAARLAKVMRNRPLFGKSLAMAIIAKAAENRIEKKRKSGRARDGYADDGHKS